MQPESAALIWDALDAAKSIVEFLDGVSGDAYAESLLRRRAVEREFEIIGESLGRLRRVDPEIASRVPDLQKAIGLRNVLIHGYAEVVDERVYATAIDDLPEIVESLSVLLAEVDES